MSDDMSATAGKRQRCAALRKDGGRCQALATHSGLCFAHSPESNAWRSRGGCATRTGNRAMKLLPARLVPIFERLVRVYEQLDTGAYDRQQATAMATVAAVLIRIVQAGELEERVRELEERVREGQRESEQRWG